MTLQEPSPAGEGVLPYIGSGFGFPFCTDYKMKFKKRIAFARTIVYNGSKDK